MLEIRFTGTAPTYQTTIGAALRFRVAGNFIREADTGEILARYHNHYWEVSGKHYTHYRCDSAIRLHFEDAEGGKSDVYGPFPGIEVADGSAYAEKKLVAKFMDTTLLWHDHQGDTFWPNMIIELASDT
jgi:hypothetical protein